MNKDFPLSSKGEDAARDFFNDTRDSGKYNTVFLTESTYPLKCFWVETEENNINTEFDMIRKEWRKDQLPTEIQILRTLGIKKQYVNGRS